jgi:hypothetical protein
MTDEQFLIDGFAEIALSALLANVKRDEIGIGCSKQTESLAYDAYAIAYAMAEAREDFRVGRDSA